MFLEKFMKNPHCLYLYQWGFSIFDNEYPKEYIVIFSDDFVFPDNWVGDEFKTISDDNGKYYIYHINNWFNKVLNSDIDCFECLYMNKKFILKEYVSLLIKPDLLKLRKNIDSDICKLHIDEDSFINPNNDILMFLKKLILTNQVIDNNKIISFNQIKTLYNNRDNNEFLSKLFYDSYNLLKSKTDDILKKSKIDKILQNGK